MSGPALSLRRSCAVLVAVQATLLVACVTTTGCEAKQPPRNVVIVTLDTTRPDRLSLYGHARPTSPAIDALGARGAVFDDAWSQAPNTCPSIATSLTSRRAPVTEVRGNAERLAEGVPTIAEIARDAGYRTGAFVSTVLLRHDVSALDRGFETYDDTMTDACFSAAPAQRIAERTIDAALDWLGTADATVDDAAGDTAHVGAAQRPFLLWVHLYDPHGPYTAPRRAPRLEASQPVLPSGVEAGDWPGRRRVPRYVRLEGPDDPLFYADAYDHEIAYADDELARLFDALDLSDTVVVLHADHGEAHGEDAYWFRHGNLLHDPALRIPFVLAGPGVPAGRRIGWRMRNLDLAPTVAALAGLPPLPDAEGRDVSDRLAADDEPPPVPFVAEGRRREIVRDQTGIDVRWKLRYVEEPRAPGPSPSGRPAWRVPADVTWWPTAGDRTVTSGDAPAVVRAEDAFAAWLRGDEHAPPVHHTDEMDDALRGLGYR